MNIGQSFKYTITNMIVAWGQPFVIFPSCIFSQVENMLIAQAPQQWNQQWWHFTGGCPTKVLNCSTQNKTFLLYKMKQKEREARTELMCPKSVYHSFLIIHTMVCIKQNKMCWQQHPIILSFMIVSHTSITYLGASRIIQKDILKWP